MDIQPGDACGRAAWACSMDVQHGFAAWKVEAWAVRMDIQHRRAAWTFSPDEQHRCAAWM
jgi:hypothetical protein